MDFKACTVSLTSINQADNTYCISTKDDVADLVLSIGKAGLIAPPVLKETSGKFNIICGFRRIRACRELGWSKIDCRLLSADGTHFECTRLAIADNSMQRALNLLETSRALNLLADCFSDDDQLVKAAKTLNLPDNMAAITKIKEICRLPRKIQENVLLENISLVVALMLGKMENNAGMALADLFAKLKASLNKQREIVTLITEISLREEISVQELVNTHVVQDIVTHPDMDRNQKTASIRFYLKQRRYPAICSVEKEFEKNLKLLKLGSGINLIPPAHFEGRHYTLTLSFRSLPEFVKHRETLDRIADNPALEKMLQ
ncbi:MAG: ParB N-terminal domain-containing protein [Deltaproteobacteria bacterium]|nr:ParB N-terminal domain-containing protein [Deltaproteobacteria bacterium]